MKLLAARTEAGPLLPIAKSATGVTVVVTGGLVLFVGFGSPGEFTLAVLVNMPPAGAVTVKVKFVVALAARVPRDQVAIPALVVPPLLALTKTTFVGSTSLATTLLAVDGPEFVTVIV